MSDEKDDEARSQRASNGDPEAGAPTEDTVHAAASADETAVDDAKDELSDEQEEQMRELLRGAMRKESSNAPRSDVLTGVQKKLRERSGGKFYADGWSTARHPPISTYLLTSLLMLGIVLLVYAALGSLVGEAVEVHNEPAPVRVIPPQNLKR